MAKTSVCWSRRDELQRDAPGLVQIASADAELPVDDRRVVEDEILLSGRSAVAVHQLEAQSGERLGEIPRIGDSCRRADELRGGAVEGADALQAPDDIGDMASINAPRVVQLVNDDIAQVLEDLRPARVMRQNPAVQHVRVGEHHAGSLADRLAGVLRRVAVVGEGADVGAHGVHHRLELVELVLGQGFGREQIHSAGVGVFQKPVENRQVVAECLAAGRGRDHHNILAAADQTYGFRLVAVELPDAPLFQNLPQRRVQRLRDRYELAGSGRLMPDRPDGRVGLRHPLLELRHGRLQARSSGDGGLSIKLRETQCKIHAERLRLFFARVHQFDSRSKQALTASKSADRRLAAFSQTGSSRKAVPLASVSFEATVSTKEAARFALSQREGHPVQYVASRSTSQEELVRQMANERQITRRLHGPRAVARSAAAAHDRRAACGSRWLPATRCSRRLRRSGQPCVAEHAYVVEAIPTEVYGGPERGRICTSHVERQNGSLRQWCKRLTRLTYAFSKKWEHLRAALALHFAHYNFCWIHRTIHRSPAMEAGIADHVWGIGELLAA